MRLTLIMLCICGSALLLGCGQSQPLPKFVRGARLETHLLADPVAVVCIHNAGAAGRIEVLIEREDRSQIWRTEEYFGVNETREVREPLPGCPYPAKLVVGLRPAVEDEAAPKETSMLSWGN